VRQRRFVPGAVVVFILAAAAAAGTLAFGGGGTASAAPPSSATFNPNLLLKGSNGAGEPSIRTDRLGRPFVIGPIGVPAGCKAFRVTHDGSASKFLGFPDHTAGGGDCDWALGPQETGASVTPPATDNVLAYSSLSAANITVGKSDDGGDTFGPPNGGASQVAGDDRMWMAADPKLNGLGLADVFMNYHDLTVGDIQLSISTDGGQTYTQNGPIINATDVPQAQWEVVGLSPGNFIGNIVARRDPLSGVLTLYSIFETADSGPDNVAQGVAGTANYNRVYEAVGIVTDAPGTGTPAAIAWRNYENYPGPLGANYGKLFPITAVDSAGKVYAFWSDGQHIDYKTDLTGAGWNAASAPGQIANPAGVNTVIMPWAQAGKSGIADLVFYGAQGPTAGDNDNAANVWNVYMAQTVDGGATWGVFKASDHSVHTGGICISGLGCTLNGGDRTLLDFFQVSIDPTNGAADIAYTDDHASPGSSVLYFTRQCTGTSATTGLALVNDCKAPVPPPLPPQGSTCPGPQVLDYTGDAPNNYPAGDGSNMDNLDVVNAFFGTPDATDIQVTLTIKDLEAPPPPANMLSAFWTVYWDYNGTTYFAQATSNGSGPAAVYSFSDGTYSGGTWNATGTPTGTVTAGPNGTFVITVPRSDVGNPPDGATLSNTFADVHGSLTILGGGLYYTAAADRGPDSDYGASYVVAQTCSGGGGGGGGGTPRAEKRDVLNKVNAAILTASKHDADKLKEAAKKLTDSLVASNWVDDSHLQPKRGDHVFDDEKEAVQKFAELLKDKKTTMSKDDLNSWSSELVDADHNLAQTAINDAIMQGGDAKKIADAQQEMAAGQAAYSSGNAAGAIEHYKKAWHDAQEAVKKL
jgi:hypothetical protein